MELSANEIKVGELTLRLYAETLSYSKAISEHQNFVEVDRLYQISKATKKELNEATETLERSLNKEIKDFDRHY